MESVSSRTAARILRLLPRERITRALGHLTDARVPAPLLNSVLEVYTRAYNVDLAEAERPPAGWATFNEFFTRKLRDGARTIDQDPNVVVSPADGRLDDAGAVDDARSFLVKGQRYESADLLGSADDAVAFAGGTYGIVYLSPRDYHRVHSPISGVIRSVRHIPGSLFPVNAFGVKHVPLLFARNERVVIRIDSETFGRVAVVLVGAMIVGRITLTCDGPARPPIGGSMVERWFEGEGAPTIARGDELGAFQLGSTVVMLLEKPRRGSYVVPPEVVGSAVRLGQPIVRRSGG